jgi:hypothetical protein
VNNLHFAVVVGINKYPGIGNLTAAHADAKDFYDWAVRPDGGGVRSENAHFILGTVTQRAGVVEAKPTTDQIYEALELCKDAAKLVPASQWQHTRLYFFAAGHGLALGLEVAALLAANVTRNHFGKHVSCECLLDFFSEVQLFQEVVVFADCCRPRATGTAKQIPPYWSDDPINNGEVRLLAGFAALYNQLAFEEQDKAPDELRGYFSRAILAGLNGHPSAADEHSGRVTSESLAGFVRQHMKEATESKFREYLKPWFRTPGAPGIDFGPAKAAKRYPVVIKIGSGAVNAVDILDANNRPVCQTVTRDSIVFECDLPIGFYEAVPDPVPTFKTKPWAFKVTEGGANESYG